MSRVSSVLLEGAVSTPDVCIPGWYHAVKQITVIATPDGELPLIRTCHAPRQLTQSKHDDAADRDRAEM